MPRFFLIRGGIPATCFHRQGRPEYAEYFTPVGDSFRNRESSFAHNYRLCELSSEDVFVDLRAADQALTP